jgi:hypothetical protein
VPEKNDISQQIKKYLAGELNARAMHELERRAQDDPFLMDALDGYQNTPIDIDAGLGELNSRLQQRTEKKEARIIPWRTLSIAASILILLGLGIFWYTNRKPSEVEQKNVAVAPVAPPQPEATKPSVPIAGNDTAVTSKGKSYTNLLANNTRHKPGIRRSPVAINSGVAEIAPASVAEKQSILANSADKAKDATPLNEMIVMDYTATKKADNASQNKVADITFGAADKTTVAVAQYDTAKLKEVRIKGTDIAKLDESKIGSNANAPMPGAPNQNMTAYQSQVARANSDMVVASHSYMGTPVGSPARGYLAKRPATGGGLAPLNPVIRHGKMVNGMVKESGEPVVYATVKIKGTTISTLTDSKGKFTLYSVPDSAILQVLATDGSLLQETRVTHRDMQLISIRLVVNSPDYGAAIAPNDNGVTDSERPRPSNGWEDLNSYLHQNAISPDGKTGVVKVSFTVNADNSLSDFKIVQSISLQTDNAAIKLIKDGPAWYSSSDDKAQTIVISIRFHARGK